MQSSTEKKSYKVQSNNAYCESHTKFINESHITQKNFLESIVIFTCDFYLSNYNESLFLNLNINFPESIKSSVLKRQAEFLAGRYIARRSLAELGININTIPIGKNRAPIWPPGVNASITHTDTRAICAATYKSQHQYLGIDLEDVLSSKCINEIKSSVISADEELLLIQSDLSFEEAFTLTFSAKESLFKALYASVGYYFDFKVVEIIDICCKRHTFNILLLQSLTSDLKAGKEFKGYFIVDKESVFSIIVQ